MPAFGHAFAFPFTNNDIAVLGGAPAVPANALLNEDGTPLLNEDGSYMLKED